LGAHRARGGAKFRGFFFGWGKNGPTRGRGRGTRGSFSVGIEGNSFTFVRREGGTSLTICPRPKFGGCRERNLFGPAR